MLAFAIRRLLEAAFVMVTVALLAFVLFRFVGDPVNQMVGQDTSLEDRLKLRQELGLDDPVVIQFGRFVANAARFDFGISYQMKQPVTAIISERAPATFEMLEVLRTDYIKFARARGLPQRAINFGHALRNTLVPVITVIGLQLGAIIAFAIITETVFQWPGMGLMFIQAVQNADIPVMAAYLMLVAFMFVLINFIVDLIYVRVDPRIRIFGRGA